MTCWAQWLGHTHLSLSMEHGNWHCSQWPGTGLIPGAVRVWAQQSSQHLSAGFLFTELYGIAEHAFGG